MSENAAKNAPQDDPEPEGFKIYVRAPQDAQVEQVTRFLQDFARLLSDDEKNITVEAYDDFYRPDVNEAAPEAAADEVAEAVEKPAPKKKKRKNKHAVHPIGGPKSPLYPMYICHNKFV